jgi:hypothetical protein
VLGWFGAASVAVAVVAWLALVLHYEYQVAWLGDYVVADDALFLTGIAGIALTRSVQRWGVERVGLATESKSGIASRICFRIFWVRSTRC